MDEETKKIILAQNAKLDAIYESAEKTRKYFLTTIIISVVMIVLPVLGLLVVIPKMLATVTSNYSDLLE